MKTLAPREKAIAASAALLVAVFLGNRFLLLPLGDAWRELDDRATVQESRFRRGRELMARGDRIRKEYAALAQAAAAPGDPRDATALLKDVETLAASAGVRIRDLRPTPEEGKGKLPSISVTVESSWEPLARLLRDLQSSPRLLRVEKATIQSKAEAAVLTAQLLIVRAPLDEPEKPSSPQGRKT